MLRPLTFLFCNLEIQIKHQLIGIPKGKFPSQPHGYWEFSIKKQHDGEHTEAVKLMLVEVVGEKRLGGLLSSWQAASKVLDALVVQNYR